MLLDADPTNKFGDRAELFAAMDTARSTGLDWESWYTQRQCEKPSAASMAHCARFPNASTCNADAACQFVDNLACKGMDTGAYAWHDWLADAPCSLDRALQLGQRAPPAGKPSTDAVMWWLCGFADCFPCRDADSKGCPQACEEYFCNHGGASAA